MKKGFLLAISLLLSLSAKAVDTPDKLEGCPIVTAVQAKELMEKGAKLFDVRVPSEYAEEHIKGATALFYNEKSKKEAAYDASVDQFDDSKLPASNIIFQCNGKDCWKSYKACNWAHKKGKKDLHWFRGGIPEWKEKGFPTEK